jgi:uncharacterized repeat protein (TIGR01451 family)
VRISWRPRNAQVSLVMVAGLIAVAGAVLPGRVSLAATATPGATAPRATATAQATGPDQATRAQSSAVLALTISVTDGRTAANPGDQLTYLVSVRDAGTVSAPHLKITQTLSTGLDFLSASPDGMAAGGQVTWSAGIPAGGTITFRVVARVTRTPARLLRLAAVACASAAGGSTPIVCAAHLDRLPAATAAMAASASRAAGTSDVVPLGYAAAALAALATVVIAVIARRRVRLRRHPG